MGTTREGIKAQLRHLYDTDEEAELWLRIPQKMLGGAVPEHLIEAGRGDEVLEVIAAVAEGAYL